MTNYEADDIEHNFGRFRVVVEGVVVTRYWGRQKAQNHVERLRQKVYGRSAKVVDGG